MAQSKIEKQNLYRKDIDGLRAFAVLSVVGFHVAPSYLKGGFLGVDVFFVISGFLITIILIREMACNTFSLVNFYQRRIIRIFPALLTVLFACLVMGWLLFPAGHFERLAKHIVASGFFASNFLLWSEAGYFDAVSITKPLLHLWSLAVEEQFYVFWPLVLMSFWFLGLNILTFCTLLLLSSFWVASETAYASNVAFFYSPITRAWELLAGGMLATICASKQSNLLSCFHWINIRLNQIIFEKDKRHFNSLRNLSSLLGLALVALGFYTIQTGASFGPRVAFFVVAGSCMIIGSGSNAVINKYLFSSKVAVSLGLISYPLYLWHWPLLSLATYINLPSSSEIPIILVALILSWGTFRYIETPIRKQKNKKKPALLLIVGMLSLPLLGYTVLVEGGFPKRIAEPQGLFNYFGSFKQHEYVDYSWCDGAPSVDDSWCREMEQPTTILIGDSHIDQLMNRFAENGFERFAKLVSLGAGNCPPLMRQNDPNDRCTKQIQHTLDQLKSYPTLEYAIISSWNTKYGEPDVALAEITPVLEKLIAAGLKVAYIVDNPTLKERPDHCSLAWPDLKLKIAGPPRYCTNPSKEIFEPYTKYSAFIEKLRVGFPEVFVFDPLSEFCDGTVCNIRTGDIMNYVDEGHVSDFIGKKIVDKFVDQAISRGF